MAMDSGGACAEASLIAGMRFKALLRNQEGFFRPSITDRAAISSKLFSPAAGPLPPMIVCALISAPDFVGRGSDSDRAEAQPELVRFFVLVRV